MFFAGFPDIFRIGSLAVVKETGSDSKNVTVMHYSPEQTMVTVLNFQNRKKMMVKESNIEPVITWLEIFDCDRLPLLLAIVKENLSLNKGKN